MAKNVILVDRDVDESWDFKKTLEKGTGENWSIIKCVTNKYHGNKIKVVWRYILYFLFSFKIFLKREKYNKIIAWQQFYGLLVVFFCRLFRVKNAPEIYIMTFIYKTKNKFYYKFINYIVSSKYITKIIVLSDEEKKYYSSIFDVGQDVFFCTRIGVHDLTKKIKADSICKKYYLSVGRSNRDYKFLRDTWKEDYGELIIICDSYKEEKKRGITCLDACYGDDYFNYVANCYAQIISLDDENISSGSLSFLYAMMLSKPSIVTENVTVYDYIKSGYSGLVIKKSEEELEKAIKWLEDNENYTQMCKNARREYEEKFSEASLGYSIGAMIHGSDVHC